VKGSERSPPPRAKLNGWISSWMLRQAAGRDMPVLWTQSGSNPRARRHPNLLLNVESALVIAGAPAELAGIVGGSLTRLATAPDRPTRRVSQSLERAWRDSADVLDHLDELVDGISLPASDLDQLPSLLHHRSARHGTSVLTPCGQELGTVSQ
jgi:hypothetical protein